jgi:hypothetical protein
MQEGSILRVRVEIEEVRDSRARFLRLRDESNVAAFSVE